MPRQTSETRLPNLININTILTGISMLFMILLSVVGYFGKATLDRIESTIMPKTEIQIQLTILNEKVNKTSTDIEAIKNRTTALEMELIKLKK